MKTVNLEDRLKNMQEKSAGSNEGVQDHKEREKNTLIDTLLDNCNISRRYKNKNLDRFIADGEENTRIKKIARRYILAFKNRIDLGAGLLLFGKTGTGKTLLANIILQEVIIRYQYSCLYITAIDLIRDIRKTYSNGEDTSARILHYTHYDLMVIDEIGVQKFSDDEIQLLNEVCDKRYLSVKATIIVSNMSRIDVAEKLGERVISRLTENGGFTLNFMFDDRRMDGVKK